MNQFNTTPQQEDSIDIKDLLFKILGFWPFIVASMIIGLSIVFIVNRYSTNVYELSTVLNVEEAENPLGATGVSLAFNWGGMDALESKVAVISSYTLHERVAENLGWEVSYFSTGRLLESEDYKTAPIRIEFDKNHFQPVGVRFIIAFNDDGFEITPEEDTWYGKLYRFKDKVEIQAEDTDLPTGSYSFNEWISGSNSRFKVIKENKDEESNTIFQFNTYDAIAKSNLKKVKTSTGDERGTTMMTISAQGSIPF